MIKVYRNYFSEDILSEIVDTIKDAASDRWRPSASIGAKDTESSYDTSRVAESIVADPSAIRSEIVDDLVQTINKDFDVDVYADEGWSIQKYRSENRGHFYWHQDILDFFIYDINTNTSPEVLFLRNSRPKRKISISVALNDRTDYNGGQFLIDMNGTGDRVPVDLNRGDMVVFTSETFHGVEDVLEGHRNALIIWLVDRKEFLEWRELCSDIDFESR